MFKRLRNAHQTSKAENSSSAETGGAVTKDGPRMFVRTAGSGRIEIAGAEYAVVRNGGVVAFLDKDRQVLREFPWSEVIAYGHERATPAR
jgi:hypothetical protein